MATFANDVLGKVITYDVATGDYNLEAKNLVEQAIRKFPSTDVFWNSPLWCDYAKTEPGHKTREWKVRVPQKIDPLANDKLVEGFGTRKLSYGIEEYSTTVENYGASVDYTKENVQFSCDDTLSFMTDELRIYIKKFYETKIGQEMVKSAYTITYDKTGSHPLLSLFSKAYTLLSKKKIQKFNGRYRLIMTADALDKLKWEVADTGNGALLQALPPSAKEDLLINNYIGTIGGFDIYENSDDCMYKTRAATAADVTAGLASKAGDLIDQNVFLFIGKSEESGRASVRVCKGGEPSIIHHPLGSGIIYKADGSGVETDTNNRMGSFGVNIDGFGIATEYPECRLSCWVDTNVLKLENFKATADLPTTPISTHSVQVSGVATPARTSQPAKKQSD